MSKPSRKMLDKWAENINDRRRIADFWEWLEKRDSEARVCQLDIERLLDNYHSIDQKQLEQERRALLESIRP